MSEDPMEFLNQHKAKMAQMQQAAAVAEESAGVMALMQERMQRIEQLANEPYRPPPGATRAEAPVMRVRGLCALPGLLGLPLRLQQAL